MVINFTSKTFIKASHLSEKYNLSYYDSLIVSSALLGHANILYSEDIQDGLIIMDTLTIKNPFRL